jgi:hypothetical protein
LLQHVPDWQQTCDFQTFFNVIHEIIKILISIVTTCSPILLMQGFESVRFLTGGGGGGGGSGGGGGNGCASFQLTFYILPSSIFLSLLGGTYKLQGTKQ